MPVTGTGRIVAEATGRSSFPDGACNALDRVDRGLVHRQGEHGKTNHSDHRHRDRPSRAIEAAGDIVDLTT
jgi:hypothetical protein